MSAAEDKRTDAVETGKGLEIARRAGFDEKRRPNSSKRKTTNRAAPIIRPPVRVSGTSILAGSSRISREPAMAANAITAT